MNQPWIYMYSPSRFPLPHSSILAWRIPWTAELGRVQSMELQKSDSTEVTKAATNSLISLLLLLYFFWNWGGLSFWLVVIFRVITSMKSSGLCPYSGFCYFICQLWLPSLDADLFSLWESVSSRAFPALSPSLTVQPLLAHTRFTYIFSTLFPIFVL